MKCLGYENIMKSKSLTVKSIKKYKMKKWKILVKYKVKEKAFSEVCLEAQSKTKLKNSRGGEALRN